MRLRFASTDLPIEASEMLYRRTSQETSSAPAITANSGNENAAMVSTKMAFIARHAMATIPIANSNHMALSND